MVVLPQENRMLGNLPPLLGRQRCRVGLWGHGRNFQATGGVAARMAQSLKAALSRRADWWFAYTELSADIVRGFRYPADRITVLNNSVDTTSLAAAVVRARCRGSEALRSAYGLPVGGSLGLYLGSLYGDKRLDLLVNGAVAVKRAHPDFQLAVVGAGPEAAWLRQRSIDLPWVHLLGARHGAEKAELLACADVMLNPGLVGLGILDAFAAGLPMVTTACDRHSPEIAYFDDGVNGVMTQPDACSFAAAVVRILDQPALAERLRLGCARAAVAFGLEAMIDRFCQGVMNWSASEPMQIARREGR
jgi:glycosyltransferase involved in cell wall biosynthesis